VPEMGPERVSLARIVRPHGLRGEVAAEILTGFPERLLSLTRVWLWDGADRLREAYVRSCRLTTSRGGQALFQFTHCSSIDDAQSMLGWHVQIPLSERLPLAHGQYYLTDLQGCIVREESGTELGEVAHVQETGEKQAGTPVLVVRAANRELLIPLAAEICIRIDPGAREIIVRLPQGLRELNDPKLPDLDDRINDPKLNDTGSA
jgi:16S rRNA processing protein RimM